MAVTNPLLIAHRGYARVAPENTLSAVDSAIRAGARLVEIDVQLTRDLVPFLLHDRSLERMCGVAVGLAELDAAQADGLRAAERDRFGARFEREPLARLEHFVELVRRSGVHAFVELKRVSLERFGREQVLDAVLPLLEPIGEHCTLISFDVEVLACARRRSRLPMGPVLIEFEQHRGESVRSLRPDVIFCDVEKLPASGPLELPAPLAVYEVDRAPLARALHARGARWIETFDIGGLAEALR